MIEWYRGAPQSLIHHCVQIGHFNTIKPDRILTNIFQILSKECISWLLNLIGWHQWTAILVEHGSFPCVFKHKFQWNRQHCVCIKILLISSMWGIDTYGSTKSWRCLWKSSNSSGRWVLRRSQPFRVSFVKAKKNCRYCLNFVTFASCSM